MSYLRSALFVLLCAAAAVAGLNPAFAQRNAPESLKRVALVIGNGAYPASPLKNPVNDARAVSRALKDLGFDVTHRENLTQKAMADVIRQFGARLTPGTAAVFYYAGHGMQVQGRNFLIPVDADVQAEDEVPYSTIDVGLLLGKMEQAKSPANIVILDACRDNPFARRFRPSNTGLAQMDAPIGTLLAYATAPGSVARDGGGENGVYTKHLVANLNTEGLSVEQLFKRVRVAVAQETRESQVPWESSSLKGEFVFKEAPRGRAAASQDQLIEEAVRAAAERAATLTAERIAREQAARPPAAPPQESQSAREADRLAAERESLRQERQRLEAERAAQRSEAARAAEAAKKASAPPPAKAPAATARVSPTPPPPATAYTPPARPTPATAAGTGNLPAPGDTWTYRIRNNIDKTVNYTVRAAEIGSNAIQDEIRSQNQRRTQSSGTTPELLTVLTAQAGIEIREVSPYLELLGGAEPGKTWHGLALLPNSSDFSGRVVGYEQVTVPAGTFDAIKVVFEGTQPIAGTNGRKFTATVWYAAGAKRFVKATFGAPQVMQSYYIGAVAELDTVELVEASFPLSATGPSGRRPAVAAAAPAERRPSPTPAPAATGVVGSLGKIGLPKVGDTWTYRYSDGYNKTASYTVRVLSSSATEIQDEARLGNSRQTGTHSPLLEQTGRGFSNMPIREISPYLQSLGPTEPTAGWRNINILSDGEPFAARLAGSETVQVPAGTFDTHKIIIEGTQLLRGAYGLPTRKYTVTVWYAPAVKRFVKLTFSAPLAAYPAEHDVIELTEYRLN